MTGTAAHLFRAAQNAEGFLATSGHGISWLQDVGDRRPRSGGRRRSRSVMGRTRKVWYWLCAVDGMIIRFVHR